ncbi:hypothetical protein ACUSIJ_21665 [Pseudochelatococcus sp. B33]
MRLNYILIYSALLCVGCVHRSAEQALEGKSALLGMSKTQVRMCAGLPNKTVTDDGDEIWSYERVVSGGTAISLPTLPTNFAIPMSIPGPHFSQSNISYCHAQVRFVQGRVVEVAYAGATDILNARDAACGQVVRGCIGYRPPNVGGAD